MDHKAKLAYLNDKVNCGDFNVTMSGNILKFEGKDGKGGFEREAPKGYKLKEKK